jgi:hypothetical protein
MNAKDLKRIIKEELVAILAENAPAKEKETTTAPPKTTPSTTPKRRGFDRPAPGVDPKPKAGLKEEEMIDKIVARFKSSKKSLDELGFNYPGKPEPRAGSMSEYERGYEEGFRAALEAMAAKLGIDSQLFNA